MNITQLNAEAVRPRSEFIYRKTKWKVISNNTHKRHMVLEDITDPTNRMIYAYAPGIPINCYSVPHLRSV